MIKKMLMKWLIGKVLARAPGLIGKLASGALKTTSLKTLFAGKVFEHVFRQFADKGEKEGTEQTYESPSQGSGKWTPPATARPWLSRIYKAEARHNMPENLLARLIWQESRYRDDIISGKTISSAGAVGIAQIVPRWHPDVDPLDANASIDYAADYLSRLKRQFGDWPTALAAYNWGQGNVRNAQKKYGSHWLEKAPTETRNYVTRIWRDVV